MLRLYSIINGACSPRDYPEILLYFNLFNRHLYKQEDNLSATIQVTSRYFRVLQVKAAILSKGSRMFKN